MDSYDSLARFHLPGIFEFWNLYSKILLPEYKINRYKFKDNVEIGSVYDSPGGIFNGGRLMSGLTSPHFYPEIKEFLEDMNIPLRFVCSNNQLQEQHLVDTYSNDYLDFFNTGRNEIIVSSNLLEDYLRQKYGDSYKYISSTTKVIRDSKILQQELNKNYYLVVLDYLLNHNMKLLKKLDNREKIELLLNAYCNPNCKKRFEHYECESTDQIKGQFPDFFPCPWGYKRFDEALKNSTTIHREEINDYLALGIHNFKIEGRGNNPVDLVESLVYYLIKEEYAIEMRIKMLTL